MALQKYPTDQIPERNKSGFSAKWQAFLIWFVAFVPELNNFIDNVKTEIATAAADKFAEIDGLDNAGLINTVIESRLDKATPANNLLQFSGTFTDRETYTVAPDGDPSGAFINENNILVSFNTSVASLHASFTVNSSTFGGGGAALHADVESLINATSRGAAAGQALDGYTFNVAKVVGGSGTASPKTFDAGLPGEVTKYRMFGERMPQSKLRTVGYWIKSNNFTLLINCAAKYGAYNNESKTNSIIKITAADGWVHIMSRINSGIGLDIPIEVYGSLNTEALIAWPVIAEGNVNITPTYHVTPIVSNIL